MYCSLPISHHSASRLPAPSPCWSLAKMSVSASASVGRGGGVGGGAADPYLWMYSTW